MTEILHRALCSTPAAGEWGWAAELFAVTFANMNQRRN